MLPVRLGALHLVAVQVVEPASDVQHEPVPQVVPAQLALLSLRLRRCVNRLVYGLGTKQQLLLSRTNELAGAPLRSTLSPWVCQEISQPLHSQPRDGFPELGRDLNICIRA